MVQGSVARDELQLLTETVDGYDELIRKFINNFSFNVVVSAFKLELQHETNVEEDLTIKQPQIWSKFYLELGDLWKCMGKGVT